MRVDFGQTQPSLWADRLGLSARTSNALHNNGVNTLDELLSLSDDDMMNLRGFGKTAYDEVTSVVANLSQEEVEELMHQNHDEPTPFDHFDHPEEQLRVSVESLGLSARTTNALTNNGIHTLRELSELSFSDLSELRGLGAKGVSELSAFGISAFTLRRGTVTYTRSESVSFQDYITSSLKERQLRIIERYYGLVGAASTLQIVGEEEQVTRERVRQIIKKTLVKIKKDIDSGRVYPSPKEALVVAAEELTPINALPELSSVYPDEAMALLFADIYPEEISIFKSPRLQNAWVVSDSDAMSAIVDRSYDALMQQVGPVHITELAKVHEIPEGVLYDFTGTTISNEFIVLSTNRRAMGVDRVYEITQLMDSTVRPMSVSEIAKHLGVNERIARSLLGRVPGVVNVGLSTYAMEKYGYSNKKTAEIIYELLTLEGEPVPMDRVIDYVQKYRTVSDGAVYGAISVESHLFSRLDDNYLALSEWGYEPAEQKVRKLEVSAVDAVMHVLERGEAPLSQGEILKRITATFGDKSTGSQVTVASVLKKLVESGVVRKLGTSRSPFYILS